jgi:NADPH-dependent 2,4-dienoyl-CoA reductase/sulfur reductase-like enzyme
MSTPENAELAVIGAGPAGMAAAITAAEHGGNVVLLDEQPSPGGQIYRAVDNSPASRDPILGDDYLYGRQLTSRIHHPQISYRPNAKVWRVDDDGQLCYSIGSQAHRLSGSQIIIATGALERPMPLPGWTLPGVITAGAGQIMLKTSGLVPDNAVLAGSGPLLYLLAVQMIRAGSPPAAIVETRRQSSYFNAARHLPAAMANWRILGKGIGLLAQIRKAGIRRYQAADDLRIVGSYAVSAIQFKTRGRQQQIECDCVMLHQGVVPNTQISRVLRLTHQWHPLQRCFVPNTDASGKTDNPLFHIAGDGAGINGALAAQQQGTICALNALHKLGKIDESAASRAITLASNALNREYAARPFIETLYTPSEQVLAPADDTIICRCEEVTAGTIRRQVSRGCTGPNQTKAFSRCGMGPCQGRYCGLTVTEILARENALTHDEVGAYRIRAPIKPVTLAELASLHD